MGMGTIHVPWFVRSKTVDEAILIGAPVDLNITCNECGVWGDYATWAGTFTGGKMCPNCGSHKTERLVGHEQ
jgi:hypothetical protein